MRKKITKNKKIVLKLVAVFLQSDFTLLNQEDLIYFGYHCIMKEYIVSQSFRFYYLAWTFKILEKNIGNQTFDFKSNLTLLIKLIWFLNDFYYHNFHQQIFKSFTKMLNGCNMLFMESKAVIKKIFIFLFEFYHNYLLKSSWVLQNQFYQKEITTQIQPSMFDDLILQAMKPYYMNILAKSKKFAKTVNFIYEISQQQMKISKNTHPKHLILILDNINVILGISCYRSLRSIVKIKWNFFLKKLYANILMIIKFCSFSEHSH